VASRRLRFHPAAAHELESAAAWYEERTTGLGGEFVEAVRAVAESLLEAPERWPAVRGTRRALVHRFPYAIVYRLKAEDTLEIVAVAHYKRRPRYWSGR